MYINGRFLTQRTTGVQRYARELITAATQHNLWKEKVELLVPPSEEPLDQLAGLPMRTVGSRGGHAWEQLDLSRAAGDELLLGLCATAPLLKRRQMIVLHDAAVAAFPQSFTLAFRLWYQVMIRSYALRARKIATVSKFSAGEINKYFGVPLADIDVVPNAPEHILRTPADFSLHEKHGLKKGEYFLAVSSLAPNKNFKGVLQAVSRLPRLPFTFVIVGGRNAKVFKGAEEMDISGAVEVGYVSDGHLRAFYENAACFVYPSFYEGFGIPPLEAMACGCPVLVSNTTSLPEVCGDGAAYCDPYDADDIARQLARILESSQLRAELHEAGLARARHWTWEKSARTLTDVIGRIL